MQVIGPQITSESNKKWDYWLVLSAFYLGWLEKLNPKPATNPSAPLGSLWSRFRGPLYMVPDLMSASAALIDI